jgi:hypothetical protein
MSPPEVKEISNGGSAMHREIVAERVERLADLSMGTDGPERTAPLTYRHANLDLSLGRISAGRSVHVTRAAFVQPPGRLAIPIKAGATSLILSDSESRFEVCQATCHSLRDRFPRANITAVKIDYADFWQCRSAPKADVIIDLGHLLHDAAPDRTLSRFATMADDAVFVCAMILPPFDGPPDARFGDGQIVSSKWITPPSTIAASAAAALSSRGIELPQLDPISGPQLPVTGRVDWRWFFSPAGLVKIGEGANLRAVDIFHTWNDVDIAIEFRKL